MRKHLDEKKIIEENFDKKKFLKKCVFCGRIGYDPALKHDLEYPYYKLSPLNIDENGLCDDCAKLFEKNKASEQVKQLKNAHKKISDTKKDVGPLIRKATDEDKKIDSYKDLINGFNEGYIKRINFRVRDYAHYDNCIIERNLEWTTLNIVLEVRLTKDGKEGYTFHRKFDEKRKIFNMGRKGTFNFQQLWSQIEILEIEFF